jgi:hypothetical protein
MMARRARSGCEPMKVLRLRLLTGELAVARLAPSARLPPWAAVARSGTLVSWTRTPDELSVVCAAAAVPPVVTAERGFRALAVVGPLDFSLTGVLAALATPLAEAGVSLFALSTYDTDYVLVRATQLRLALTALRRAGHTVASADRDRRGKSSRSAPRARGGRGALSARGSPRSRRRPRARRDGPRR